MREEIGNWIENLIHKNGDGRAKLNPKKFESSEETSEGIPEPVEGVVADEINNDGQNVHKIPTAEEERAALERRDLEKIEEIRRGIMDLPKNISPGGEAKAKEILAGVTEEEIDEAINK